MMLTWAPIILLYIMQANPLPTIMQVNPLPTNVLTFTELTLITWSWEGLLNIVNLMWSYDLVYFMWSYYCYNNNYKDTH